MYDVIVVGARCAGSPLAMLLAKSGHSVLVLDRAKFPSDTLSTHYITPDGVIRLKDWGLFDRVVATGCEPTNGIARTIQGMRMPADPNDPPGIAPRRTALDYVLVQAAREAGAEIREGAIVEGVITEDGKVVGVRGRSGKTAFEERAKVVVGADGRQSTFAGLVGAESYNQAGNTTAGYYAYYKNFEHNGPELYLGNGLAMFVFPTNDGETCLGVEFPAARFQEFRADLEKGMLEAFDTQPGFGERYRKAERSGKIMGTGPHESYYRKPYGPGWALVGDAGYYRDPLLGQGINDAFRDADELAVALHAVLSGKQEWEPAMVAYQQQRDEATGPVYGLTNLLCQDLNPSPQILQMMMQGPPEPAAAPA